MSIRRPRRDIPALAITFGCIAAQASGQSGNRDWRKLNSPEAPVLGEIVRGPLSSRGGSVAGFPASNITLLSWLPLNVFPNSQRSGNDCWGYVSPSGREYALFGMQSGFSVLEVTDPTDPRQIGFIPGNGSVWRDVKVIGHYAYGVSEGGLGIQVIDLSDVDSGVVTHVRNKVQNGHSSTHNIASNPDSGYLYLCGANIGNGGLVAVSTADPTNPTIVGAWTTRYVHDAQIITYTTGPFAGREIAFCCTGGAGLDIVDVTNKGNMTRIGSLRYPGTHYCHQAWVSSDRQFLFVNDEMDEGTSFSVTTTHVVDISDPTRPTQVTTFTSGSASTDHNLYVVGDIAYEANYMSGLRVFDISDPMAAEEIAYLDTSPDKDAPGYHGAWSNYPFFPSGTILVSDIERGLFLVRLGESGLSFAFPDGIPELARPGVPTPIRVSIGEDGAELDPASVRIVLDTAGGPIEIPMVSDGEGGYEAALPAEACFQEHEFWVAAKDTQGLRYIEPFNAPISGGIRVQVATGAGVVLADDFASDTGWVVDNSGASSGGWHRVAPEAGNDLEPELDADGSGIAYLTGAAPGESLEGGPVTLTSPRMDLSGSPSASLHYAYWYAIEGTLVPPMLVAVSNDDGATWQNIAEHQRDTSWRTAEIRLDGHITPTDRVRVRFTVNNSIGFADVEAGVDDFRVSIALCEPCIADYNGDGDLSTLDFLAYLNDFTGATHDRDPDLNADGEVNSIDFLLFLNLYVAGCD